MSCKSGVEQHSFVIHNSSFTIRHSQFVIRNFCLSSTIGIERIAQPITEHVVGENSEQNKGHSPKFPRRCVDGTHGCRILQKHTPTGERRSQAQTQPA